MLAEVLDFTARQFARAIVMPNLDPPVTTTAEALAYRRRILATLRPDRAFTPLMTAYLTDGTDAGDIADGFGRGVLTACKLYPAHATTNSAKGVTEIRRVHGVLETMERIGMPLLVHGEVTDVQVDIFDREAVFIDRVLRPVVRDFPGLKVVCEHVTTADAVGFVEGAGPNVGATITPHHLQYNRNAIFQGGLRPHMYCLPVLKREHHRLALRKAATSGSPKFFLGTDSAPHAVAAKESASGCAGVFNAPVALESYATVFDEDNALDKLEGFASEHGARFYGVPLNEGQIMLTRAETSVSERIQSNGVAVIPYHAGTTMAWRCDGEVAAR